MSGRYPFGHSMSIWKGLETNNIRGWTAVEGSIQCSVCGEYLRTVKDHSEVTQKHSCEKCKNVEPVVLDVGVTEEDAIGAVLVQAVQAGWSILQDPVDGRVILCENCGIAGRKS